MKAIVCTAYGSPDVLQLTEVSKPIPGDDDVLVKVHAATVTMGDCELRNLTLPAWTRIPVRLIMGYSKPKNLIPGMEFSGVVESIGKNVTTFKIGDAVLGSGGMQMGSCAEYKKVKATALAIKLPEVSFEEAATVIVGGLNALHFLRKANVIAGQHVLVIGAGGSIGSYAVLLAKFFGAEVTAIESTNKLDKIKSIGADHVIDYTKEDFTKNGKKYDVIFDVVYGSSFDDCATALKDEGCYLMANTNPSRMLRGLWRSWTTKKKFIFALAGESVDDMKYITELIASNKIKPLIDKRYALAQTAQAHQYVEEGHKTGNVIINVV
ncbi:MAG TPA: NAD(P)-dependent alcohol dehydrogenase [Chryseolinea sp.]|nr:NAD(P)-dependent alcohol dehydrogenase [Chryseolinea sp.]HPM32224.1 NAD(P)-dependent alcohol dehydrogenase [Chryseolinea sp.]